MFGAIREHFREAGVKTVRTLADRTDTRVGGFLDALGFSASALQALENRLDGERT
jgi:hypothetical protein